MAAQTLSSQGPGAWIPIQASRTSKLSPSVLCAVSAGASLTYSVEVSGDSPFSGSPSSVFPLDPSAVGLTASANFQISGQVWWVRANITAYTSGSLLFQVAQ